jgi:hypothetical protein
MCPQDMLEALKASIATDLDDRHLLHELVNRIPNVPPPAKAPDPPTRYTPDTGAGSGEAADRLVRHRHGPSRLL